MAPERVKKKSKLTKSKFHIKVGQVIKMWQRPLGKTCRAPGAYPGSHTNLATLSESWHGLLWEREAPVSPCAAAASGDTGNKKVSQMFLHASLASSSAWAESISEAGAFRRTAARHYS